MASIKTRQRKDGSLAYLSEVRVKRNGRIVHRESRTIGRRTQAKAWAESREDISEVRPMGRSKTSNIRFLEKCEIARLVGVVRDNRTGRLQALTCSP